MQKSKELIIILIIVGFFAYIPSLFGSFIWDDEDFVYANEYVKQFQIGKFFTSNAVEGRGKMSNYYRPIQFTLYALLYKTFGPGPFAFHAVAVLLHIAAAIAVFLFVRLLVGQEISAFLISLFFLMHPVQTESVSYISGLSDPLYVLFMTGSFLLYVKGKTSSYWASLFLFIISLLSKELALVFIPLIILHHLLIKKDNLKKTVSETLPFIAIAVVFLILRMTVFNFQDMRVLWGGSAYGDHLEVRIATFFSNFFVFLQILLVPLQLFMERDESIRIITHIWSFWTLYFFLFNLIVFAYAAFFSKQKRLLLFIWSCFLATLIPYLGIIPLNGVFYEHYIYFPLVFFFAFLITCARQYLDKKILLPIAGIVLCIFCTRSYMRQFEWNNNIRFYQQTLSHAPKSVRILNNLAMEYAVSGQIEEAINIYKRAILLNPRVPNLYHNLANSYLALGNTEQAETYYKKAIEVDPYFRFSYQSLILLYTQTNQLQKAEEVTKLLKTR